MGVVEQPISAGAASAIGSALEQVPALYDAACLRDLEDFEPRALAALGRLVGFDGAVWGCGRVGPEPDSAFAITRASVFERAPTLLEEYAALAPQDPVTARFLAEPQRPIAVEVGRCYRGRARAAVGDYLQRHRIAQLLLLGGEDAHGRLGARSWITVYRESGPAFGAAEVAQLRALMPLWNHARRLCLRRRMERLAHAETEGEAACALCDESGFIHVADPAFSGLTSLREGDGLQALLPLGAASGGCTAGAGLRWQLTPAGPWLLVRVRRDAGAAARVGPRERQVAQRYAQGIGCKQIAREFGTAPSTVRTQIQSVYRRLGVHSRIELLRLLEGAD